jgi:hypothetical protein
MDAVRCSFSVKEVLARLDLGHARKDYARIRDRCRRLGLDTSHFRRRPYSDADITEAVSSSFSISQVLRRLRLSPTGSNYVAIQEHFRRLGLDTSHFTGKAYLKGKHNPFTAKRPFSDILVRDSTYRAMSRLKDRLLRAGLLVNRCQRCGCDPIWQGDPLVLVLDHINGDRADHRLENLRLLCPNCNSQQPTFAGKNKGRYHAC